MTEDMKMLGKLVMEGAGGCDVTAIHAARLQALALASIAESLENISTLLATGLGKGSPVVEAIRSVRGAVS